MDIRYISSFVAVSLAIVPVFGQDLNPTVNVTNTYQGKLMEVSKKQLPMEVPDSVLKFDYLFDYSVNNNPYRGVYEFNPYSMNLNPQTTLAKVNRFYFRAGAGYLLNPVMDIVWSPYVGKKFSFSVYDHLDGFFGRTKNLSLNDRNMIVKSGMQKAPTLDLYNRLGGSARLDFDKSFLKFDAGYGLLATKDTLVSRFYNSADASVEFKSKDIENSYFLYDLTGKYTYGFDKSEQYRAYLAENLVALNADLGYVFNETHRVIGNLGYDIAIYNGCYAFTNYILNFGAKYQVRLDKAILSAGLKAATNPSAPTTEGKASQMTSKGFAVPIFPDLYASYDLFHNALTIYAQADGGRRMNTYSSMVMGNHHVTQLAECSFIGDNSGILMDNTDVITTVAGLRGRLIDALNYEARFGYDFYGNGLLDAIYLGEDVDPRYCVNYGDYKLAHVDLTATWKSKHVDIDGSFTYQSSDINKRHLQALAPSKFKADLRVMYHWADRIHAGVWADFASKRTQSVQAADFSSSEDSYWTLAIPSYVDLGIYADYSYSSKITFWIQGGNLLNQTIQRSPLYAESGINFTAGISIKL